MATTGTGSSLLDDARIQVLGLKKGDTLVLTYPGRLTEADADRIKAHLTGLLDVRVMVVGDGARLSVIREEGHEDQ